jgi:MFS family permease
MGRLLDKLGSKVVVTTGAIILAAGMFTLSLFPQNWGLFITASMLIGLGLSALLGAPIRYIMLNEARREDRAAAQAVITIFTSMGQLVSGALVGAVAASTGGGVAGYSTAYSIIGAVAVLMILLTFGLKNRATELATTTKDSSVPAASHPG